MGRPVGVGLGGGGGRTREVATPEARARQLRRTNKAAETDEERYEAFVWGSEAFSSRSLGGTPAGKTNARNALSPTSASAPGSSARARYGEGEGGFRDDSAALAAAAALREAAAAARRLKARRVASRGRRDPGGTPRGGTPRPSFGSRKKPPRWRSGTDRARTAP